MNPCNKKKTPPPNPVKPAHSGELLEKFIQPTGACKIIATSTKPKQNVFESYRPKAGHCLNYKISETYTKLDAGSTQINFKETTASYVPSPVKPKAKKRIIRFHGGPPQWKFVDEIWREKQLALQQIYKQELKTRVKMRAKVEKYEELGKHFVLQAMVGPEWFQELSPDQLKAVENLQYCINRDLQENTFINTQENIGNLGLALVPHHKLIEKALLQCCKCSVEFLLVLYQLINPNRKKYSINDRLLLSAVVHLTITSTLRELHVRIPSPPPQPRVPSKVVVKPQVIKYKSPYLEPFTFVPAPRKFTGLYENKHRQYPASPYFSYLPQMKIESWFGLDIFKVDASQLNSNEKEIFQEMMAAQKLYNSFSEALIKPKLLQPTILEFCVHQSLSEGSTVKSKSNSEVSVEDLAESSIDSQLLSDEESEIKLEESLSEELPPKSCWSDDGVVKNFVISGTFTQSGRLLPVIAGVKVKYPLPESFEDVIKKTFVISGTFKKCGEILPIIAGVKEVRYIQVENKWKSLPDESNKAFIIVGSAVVKGKFMPVIGGVKRIRDDLFVDTPFAIRKNFIITATKVTESGHFIPVMGGVKQTLCDFAENKWETFPESAEKKYMILSTAVINGLLIPVIGGVKLTPRELNPCRIQKKFIITDTKVTRCGQLIPVIGGVKEIKCESKKPREVIVKCPCPVVKNFIIIDTKVTKTGQLIPVIGGVKENRCEEKVKKIKPIRPLIHKIFFVSGATTSSNGKLLPIIGGVVYMNCERIRNMARPELEPVRSETVLSETVQSKTGLSETVPSETVPSKLETVKKKHVHSRTIGFETETKEDYIISGTKVTEDNKLIPVVGGIKGKIPVVKIIPEKLTLSPCVERCKETLDQFLSDKCQRWEARKKQKFATPILGGVVLREGKSVPVFTGVRETKCDCMREYQEKVNKYEYEQKIIERKLVLKSEYFSYVIGGVTITENGPVYNIIAVKPKYDLEYLLKCEETLKTMAEQQSEYEKNHQESVKTHKHLQEMLKHISKCKDNLYAILAENNKCTSDKCKTALRRIQAMYIISGVAINQDGERFPVIGGVSDKECQCKQEYLEKLEKYENFIKGKQRRSKLITQRVKYIIGGIVSTSDGPIYILSGVRAQPGCDKFRECTDFVEKFKKIKSHIDPITVPKKEKPDIPEESCKCRQELDKILNSNCECDECNQEDRRKNATFVSAGIKPTPSGHTLPIISGIYDKRCSCLHNYKEKLHHYDLYKQRVEARFKLKTQPDKYTISGVVNTPAGPVYVITGQRPVIYCQCAEMLKKQLEEVEQLAIMPHIPDEGIRYAIGGVKKTPAGNVFIISTALPVKECDCMKLFNKFKEAHEPCMQKYTDYLQQVQEDVAEYMDELNAKNFNQNTIDALQSYQPNEERNSFEDSGSFPNYPCCDEGLTNEGFMYGSLNNEGSINEGSVDEDSVTSCKILPVKNLALEDNLASCKDTCGPFNEEIILPEVDDPPLDGQELVLKVDETVENFEDLDDEDSDKKTFKRFVILKKLPCRLKAQMEIIKKMLDVMANDGFPLAKLPDCHKLPHFKLWMQLRCKKSWSQKDKLPYLDKSKNLWKHSYCCKYFDVEEPKDFPITREQIPLMTWHNAKYIRKIVKKHKVKYYRKVKQSAVETAREFFPGMFTYEFPYPTFRDVYFCYFPTKEIQVLPYRIVQSHEMYRNVKRMKC